MPYANNPAKAKQYNHDYYWGHKDDDPVKGQEYDHGYYLGHREHIIATSAAWQRANPGRRHQHYLNARAKLKTEGYRSLGDVCACCGFDDKRFLTMDHILPVGGLRRRSDTWAEAKRSGWDTAQFQILCGNCNFAKSDNGSCPHKSVATLSAAVPVLAFRKPGGGHPQACPGRPLQLHAQLA